MSFADLRSARKSKESKSSVKTSPFDHPFHALNEDLTSAYISDTAGWPPTDSPIVLTDPPLELPPYLNLRNSAARGRGIYAKENIMPGSILVSTRPHVHALSTANLDSYCTHCSGNRQGIVLKRCTACLIVRYCDSVCQNKDWPLHKLECQSLQRWASLAPSPDTSVPSDAVRCLGRILWNKRRKGLDSSWTKEMDSLQSLRGLNYLPLASQETLSHLAHSLVRYIGATGPSDLAAYGIPSAGDLVDTISRKFIVNTFTLTSYSLTPIGICVSTITAFANHSCDPNAVIVFPRCSKDHTQEPTMQLIAIRPISLDEEVLIAYVDTALPRELRQAALKETYGFLCNCTLCCQTSMSDPRISMYCPNGCGSICPLPAQGDSLTQCAQCRGMPTSSDAVLDAVRIGGEALDKAAALQFKDPALAMQLTTNMLPILAGAGLTPSCHPLLAMTRLHQELLIVSLEPSMTQETLDGSIRTATKYNAGLRNILTYGHPVRAVALVELGKLLAVDEPSPPEQPAITDIRLFPPHGPTRLKLAYETLVQARSELIIGFGKANEGGQLGKELREILVRVEKELGVWGSGVHKALHDSRLSRSVK